MATQHSRKLFSRGEWLTLIGMATVVISAALIWGRSSPNVNIPGTIGVVYRNKLTHNETAYDIQFGRLSLGWVIVTGAVICASLLLLDPSAKEKRLFQMVHAAISIGIITVALLHIGPHPGVIAGTLGGIVLLAGAILRYQ